MTYIKNAPPRKESKNKVFLTKNREEGGLTVKTRYRVLKEKNNLSLIEVDLLTGRTHQIRVQFSSRRMPLVGDGKYGSKINNDLALWSHKIAFTHPKTKQLMEFTAEPPRNYPWNQF